MFGGTLGIHAINDGLLRIEIGDVEGLSDDYVFECETVDEGLALAEKQVDLLIADAKDLQSMYLSGDVKSVDQEVIRITGVPPIPNPHYKGDH
ncbi:hypothetical protein [Kaarinaea lacus]